MAYNVLVVDDSAFMRKMLVGTIASEPDLEVVGIARDGVEALNLVEKLKPDVVTLDIELPEIDGIACVAYIMEEFPTPIVIVTGFSEFLGEETIVGLEYGAVGLLRKPGQHPGRVQNLQAGALPVLAQALNQWIAACLGQTRVDHFDHDIDELHRPLHFLASLVHVTGKPLYCHKS